METQEPCALRESIGDGGKGEGETVGRPGDVGGGEQLGALAAEMEDLRGVDLQVRAAALQQCRLETRGGPKVERLIQP